MASRSANGVCSGPRYASKALVSAHVKDSLPAARIPRGSRRSRGTSCAARNVVDTSRDDRTVRRRVREGWRPAHLGRCPEGCWSIVRLLSDLDCRFELPRVRRVQGPETFEDLPGLI